MTKKKNTQDGLFHHLVNSEPTSEYKGKFTEKDVLNMLDAISQPRPTKEKPHIMIIGDVEFKNDGEELWMNDGSGWRKTTDADKKRLAKYMNND